MRDIDALIAYLASRARTPFEWGRRKNDCIAFMAGAVEALTGVDPIPDLDWTDEKSGARVIARLGGLEKAIDDRLERIAPAMAKRGDVAAVPAERFGISVMIVEGATLVGPGDAGAERLPRSAMVAAWSAEPKGRGHG